LTYMPDIFKLSYTFERLLDRLCLDWFAGNTHSACCTETITFQESVEAKKRSGFRDFSAYRVVRNIAECLAFRRSWSLARFVLLVITWWSF